MRRKLNLYGTGKALIADAMTLNDWWKKPDYDWAEIVKFFGAGAALRGVEEAMAKGETIPDEVKALVGITA